MKIKMLKDQKGSPNGIAVMLYRQGEVYDVPDRLGKSFVEVIRCAEPFSGVEKSSPVVKEVEAKALQGAPENKSLNGAQTETKADQPKVQAQTVPPTPAKPQGLKRGK